MHREAIKCKLTLSHSLWYHVHYDLFLFYIELFLRYIVADESAVCFCSALCLIPFAEHLKLHILQKQNQYCNQACCSYS